MIRFAHPIHPDEGYAIALNCPLILCDTCGEQITREQRGNVLWLSTEPERIYHVHVGACDLTKEATFPDSALVLNDHLDKWLERLTYNYTNPLVGSEVPLPDGSATVVVRSHT